MFMENRPEYVATWLGLAKIGVVPALINYNLKKDALIHTIRVANCKAIIYGVEFYNTSAPWCKMFGRKITSTIIDTIELCDAYNITAARTN